MSYMKAADVLPQELIDKIQIYIDGGYVYIRRKESSRRAWGECTNAKEAVLLRNMEIYREYAKGMSIAQLSEIYFLSPKSIQKIIAKQRLETKQ